MNYTPPKVYNFVKAKSILKDQLQRPEAPQTQVQDLQNHRQGPEPKRDKTQKKQAGKPNEHREAQREEVQEDEEAFRAL